MTAAINLTFAQAEVLRRCMSDPDVDGGWWSLFVDWLYEPLVRDGLLERSIRPWKANSFLELVHYETTEAGKWALAIYDRQRAREAQS